MTIVIIIISVVVSLIAILNQGVSQKLRFNAYAIKHFKEWYRFFTYALIHADWMHLLVNMFVLYSFGMAVENYFSIVFPGKATFYFIILYIGGIIISVTPAYSKNKDNVYYNAVGASGAVSAVVFSSIIFFPTAGIRFLFIPFAIPSVVFGILYLIYSAYMAKRSRDNIGHDAHFWGAIFGIAYTIIIKPRLALLFFEQIRQYFA
ncbi:MAG: rhomboid family intramembrane serine protease [Bacteroidales bacterium]|nr:rhomboid family intramembrane serine protease [Bacteroidales bacterium]